MESYCINYRLNIIIVCFQELVKDMMDSDIALMKKDPTA